MVEPAAVASSGLSGCDQWAASNHRGRAPGRDPRCRAHGERPQGDDVMSDGLVAEDAALDHARAILDGRYVVPARQATRLAALLVRQALEAAVLVLCGPDMRRAS